MSDNMKRDLIKQLKSNDYPIQVREEKPLDLIRTLRDSRRAEYITFGNYDGRNAPTFRTIGSKINDISILNERIEDSVKMEVLGIQEDPWSKIVYKAKKFIRRSEYGQPAESIFEKQMAVIDSVGIDIRRCSQSIDSKLERLEERYDVVLNTLIKKYDEAKSIRDGLNDKKGLAAETMKGIQNAADFKEKIEYIYANRNIRKRLNTDIHKIKMNDRAVAMLVNEMPVINNLSGICEAYSFSLKETLQEVEQMQGHLQSVISLYLDMMRTQRVDVSLEPEIKKLFGYTHNMTSALEEGERRITRNATEGTLFQKELGANTANLDGILNRIERGDYNAFTDLENKINGYLTAERRDE